MEMFEIVHVRRWLASLGAPVTLEVACFSPVPKYFESELCDLSDYRFLVSNHQPQESLRGPLGADSGSKGFGKDRDSDGSDDEDDAVF
jgi:hypothetical protein